MKSLEAVSCPVSKSSDVIFVFLVRGAQSTRETNSTILVDKVSLVVSLFEQRDHVFIVMVRLSGTE